MRLRMRLRLRMHLRNAQCACACADVTAGARQQPLHRKGSLPAFIRRAPTEYAGGDIQVGPRGRRYDWYKVEGSDPWNALLGLPPPCRTTPA